MSGLSRISIIQHNTNRNPNVMYSLLEIARESATDFVLVQEPWIEADKKDKNVIYTISHPTYNCILPNTVNGIRPRVAIFAKKQSVYKFCQRTDITADSDIIIIDVSGQNIDSFQIINVYNEKSLNSDADADADADADSTDYTVERSLQNIQLSMETLIAGDLNAHHSWWNSSINNNVRSDSLVS